MATEELIVKDQIEINASKEKVWEVLTNPDKIKQWDDIPENYQGGHLKLGSAIQWEGYSKLTVTEFHICSNLRLKMSLPKVNLKQSEYNVSYNYTLTGDSKKTVLKFEIGDFSPLPNSQNYHDTTKEWIVKARKKIKQLSED
jgi:hypothetical protein